MHPRNYVGNRKGTCQNFLMFFAVQVYTFTYFYVGPVGQKPGTLLFTPNYRADAKHRSFPSETTSPGTGDSPRNSWPLLARAAHGMGYKKKAIPKIMVNFT